MKLLTGLILILTLPLLVNGQEEKENLGDKEYVIIKDYKPVLGESFKISDSPEGDTSTSTPPPLDYSIRPLKMTSDYELSTIKAVKIKDEQLAKLYRSYLKLGIGNYTTYTGDLYVNALRSKKGTLGFAVNHRSGNPGLKNAGSAGFSKTHAGVNGKYFLEHSTFSGDLDYDRKAVHFYGYNPADTIIEKSLLKQRFNNFGMLLSLGSNYLSDDHLDYKGTFGFSTINDINEVTENDFLIGGKLGKKEDVYYVNLDMSFNYFKKTLAKSELLTLNNELSRSIVTFIPTVSFNRDNIDLVLGLNFGVEKNLGSKIHFFPKIDLSLPIAEHILYAFVGVNGNIIKNSFKTISDENPFVTSSLLPLNTINKLELKAGLNGNFSSLISFMAQVKHTTYDRMLLFYDDVTYFNKFNVLYIDGKVLNLHAELTYTLTEKFTAALRFDQYSYSMEQNAKAWHKPNTEVALNAKYNFWDKIIINAALFSKGKYFVRIDTDNGYYSKKVDGYFDANLGLEYRYSKILSIYVDLNNLGVSRYYLWNDYPSERLNVIGGIKYSF